jgi:hypothetical protein
LIVPVGQEFLNGNARFDRWAEEKPRGWRWVLSFWLLIGLVIFLRFTFKLCLAASAIDNKSAFRADTLWKKCPL